MQAQGMLPLDRLNQEPKITIFNEFAAVQIRKVETRNGVRLEISSAKLGHTILLDAMELESLTWQKKEVFSQFLQKPFGGR